MASSSLRAPAAAAGQQQSRLMEMQKKFQQKHLAAVAAMNNSTKSMKLSNNTTDPPAPPAGRLGGVGVGQQQRQVGKGVGSIALGNGSDSVVQVDVKGKVRQLFAERNQQQQIQGLGYQHHQQLQLQRQRRRSLTGRDRSRPLRPLSGTDNDPLCKTVCFTAPSMAGGADSVGIKGTGSDLRSELLALFGRLPNLGGQLLSESFRGNNKMKTAQSAPELKWLLDNGTGKAIDGGPGPPVMTGPRKNIGGSDPQVGGSKKVKVVAPKHDDDDNYDEDDIDESKQQQRPVGNRINGKTATVSKKPLTTTVANGNGGAGRGSKNAMAGGKPVGGAANHTNRLLLPPVVQPTVINALAAGAGAAAAVASVNAATVAGAQKPLVRAAKLPPTNHGTQQKPTAPPRRVVVTPQSSKVTAAASRQPIPKRAVPAPAMSPTRPQPVKKQLSMDRGPPAQGMARCSLCARDFKTDRLPKHEEVCRKRNRKRKVFDASRQRLEGVAAETGMDVSSLKKMSQKSDQQVADKLRKKKDAWRRKHDQLVRNVRAARAVQRHLAAGGSLRDLPPELENDATNQDDEVDSGLVKCPHCNRTFNEAAAERHVPLCAERQRNAAARLQNKKR